MSLATGPTAVGPNTILLRVNRISDKAGEAYAGGTITPGDIIRSKANGDVIRHDQAGKFYPVLIAKEDTFQGKTIDDDYSSGDVVFFHRAMEGDTWNANIAASQGIGFGDFLASNGDGKLKVCGASDTALATAEAALTSVASVQRLEARMVGPGPAGTLGTTTTTTTTT